jgi:hypothetical protein
MSTDRDTTSIVRSWLRTDEHESADRVLGTVLDRLDTTPQRRATGWPTRRLPHMNSTAKLALGLAAVVVAALLGIRFLGPGGENVGGSDETPTPTPTPTPVALPDTNGDLGAGTYFVDDPAVTPVRFTFQMPAGWETIAGTFVGKISGSRFYVALSPWVVDQAYTDPCQWLFAELDPPLGPTVEDLANALANQVGRDATTPTDVMLGGYPGQMVELSVPDDFDATTCDNDEFRMWRSLGSAGGYNYGPGQRDTVYIIDVDGERLVFHAMYTPTASEEDVAEIQAIVDSIRIEP